MRESVFCPADWPHDYKLISAVEGAAFGRMAPTARPAATLTTAGAAAARS